MLRSLSIHVAAVALCLGSPLNVLLATDYFVVDNGGPTGGDGSAGSPWGTITEALNSGSLSSGDTLDIAAGTYDAADGEVFPLTLPSGVTFQGAGMDTTRIDGSGVGTRVIEHLGNSAISAVHDVEIQAGAGSTACISITTNVRNFEARDCRFLGGRNAVEYGGGGAGPVEFTMRSNTISGGTGQGLRFTHGALTGGFASDVTLNFLENTVIGGGTSFDGVLVRITAGGLARGNVNVLDNAFSDISGPAIDGSFPSYSGFMVTNLAVERNTITGAAVGLTAGFSANSSGTGQAELSIADNVIQDTTGHGILLSDYAGFFTTFHVDGAVTGNTISNAGGAGIVFAMTTTSQAFAFADVDFLYNNITTCSDGVNVSLQGFGFGMSSNNVFRGNVITGNAINGVLVGNSSVMQGGSGPDFGNSTTTGRNTLQGNNTAGSSSAFDYKVQVFDGFTSPSLQALGNFWGNTTLSAIEAQVFHYDDSSSYEQLSFNNPLRNALQFEVVDVATAPGHPARLRALPGSAFVPYAGNVAIDVRVDGVPAVNPAVSADGRELKFHMPDVAPQNAVVTVTNPGGQSGSRRILDRAPPAGRVPRRP